MGYSYYDTPEGEDIGKKLFYTGKYAAAAGLSAAVVDVFAYSHTKGYGPILARIGFWTVPFVGMAAMFTSTTYILTNIRKKNDKVTYFLGGASAGPVAGAMLRNPWQGAFLAVAFGTAAVIKKLSIEDGWVFFPDTLQKGSTATSHRDWDFSGAPPSTGNWVR